MSLNSLPSQLHAHLMDIPRPVSRPNGCPESAEFAERDVESSTDHRRPSKSPDWHTAQRYDNISHIAKNLYAHPRYLIPDTISDMNPSPGRPDPRPVAHSTRPHRAQKGSDWGLRGPIRARNESPLGPLPRSHEVDRAVGQCLTNLDARSPAASRQLVVAATARATAAWAEAALVGGAREGAYAR
eukprot:scaffold2707_cov417-Prasinococcus_capsulatus_cf.AAC.11